MQEPCMQKPCISAAGQPRSRGLHTRHIETAQLFMRLGYFFIITQVAPEPPIARSGCPDVPSRLSCSIKVFTIGPRTGSLPDEWWPLP